MLQFGERSKTLLTLLAAIVACVGTGMWAHHRFVTIGLKYSRQEAAFQTLREQVLNGVQELPDADPSRQSADSAELLRWVARQAECADVIWLVVDQRGIVTSGPEDTLQKRPDWRPAIAEPKLGGPYLQQVMQLGDQQFAAFTMPLANRSGFLVGRAQRPLLEPDLHGALWLGGIGGFVWISSLLSVAVYLVVTRLFDAFRCQRTEAEAASLQHAESMARMRDAVIFGLAKLTESRDPETGFHLERISLLSSKLAQALRKKPRFRPSIDLEFVRLLETSSILHDIGKVGVEDAVLLKPGPLSPAERERMQEHATIGGRCIQDIERRLGRSNFLQMAREIAFSHHERWDGEGYPQGLAGENIPLAARIVAVVDVYEALSSKRIYKEPLPHDECVALIREQSGKHFDPEIVAVFLEIAPFFEDVCRRFANTEETNKTETRALVGAP